MSALRSMLGLGRPVAPRLALAVLAGVAAAACAVGLTATSAWLISAAALQPPLLTLMVAITAVRAFGIGRGVFRYGERLAAHDAAFRVLAELRAAAYARLARLAPAGLDAFRSGDLLARVVGDVDALADLWLRLLLPYLSAALVALGVVLLVGWLLPAAAVVLAVTLLLTAVGAPLASLGVARRADAAIAPARGALADATVDLLAGAPELLATGAVGRATAPIVTADARLAGAEQAVAAGAGLGTLVAGLASGAAVWCSLLAGIVAVRDGSLAGVALAVVALTPIAVHEVVAPLVPAARQLPGLAAAATRVRAILDRPDPVADPKVPGPVPAGPLGLEARDLALRYPAATADAVTGIDVVVSPGERVVVTGPSGSGKSTFAAACLRFLDPTAGSLAVIGADGPVDLRDLAGDDVRRAIGLCEQDPWVFDATLADNLRLARPGAPDDELRDALARAGLLAWVDGLPRGVETPVGEHGSRLSGGQRQRLGIARALLADVRVLILDEPTEHLDEEAARALVADLEGATAGRTVVVLTHRPELFPADRWRQALHLR
ncbi:MAG TPA: thiol reductant ABC exporter subunit CydC [Candidatus Limnocylindrales bacterium]|nr:thiol reductant ABC exporter subunit CydC [Candidatus Limnocylindrales bacterium]